MSLFGLFELLLARSFQQMQDRFQSQHLQYYQLDPKYYQTDCLNLFSHQIIPCPVLFWKCFNCLIQMLFILLPLSLLQFYFCDPLLFALWIASKISSRPDSITQETVYLGAQSPTTASLHYISTPTCSHKHSFSRWIWHCSVSYSWSGRVLQPIWYNLT